LRKISLYRPRQHHPDEDERHGRTGVPCPRGVPGRSPGGTGRAARGSGETGLSRMKCPGATPTSDNGPYVPLEPQTRDPD
jgi:hypothetical protein